MIADSVDFDKCRLLWVVRVVTRASHFQCLEQGIHTRVCLLLPVEASSQATVRNYLVQTSITLLFTIYTLLISHKVRAYVAGICPNGRMAAIGLYRRNLISFEENSRYIFFWSVSLLVQLTAQVMTPIIFPGTSSLIMFWISHGNGLSFIWFFHGIILPLTMEVPWKSRRHEKKPAFYVRPPHLPLLPRYTVPSPASTSHTQNTPNTPALSSSKWKQHAFRNKIHAETDIGKPSKGLNSKHTSLPPVILVTSAEDEDKLPTIPSLPFSPQTSHLQIPLQECKNKKLLQK